VPIALGKLPPGVMLSPLVPHTDDRGSLVELWRTSWGMLNAAQWNASRSQAGVLRGVHVHPRHADYLVVISGRMVVGLRDLRDGARTTALVELDGTHPEALVITPGVAHGFWFPEPSWHCYAVDHEFDPADELGCRFDDPDLGIPWPSDDVTLSERDRKLPPLAKLQEHVG
jgi:dTDP-4-dehydrorhamnose 3,5-epimerase